jgi:hypothetical protein
MFSPAGPCVPACVLSTNPHPTPECFLQEEGVVEEEGGPEHDASIFTHAEVVALHITFPSSSCCSIRRHEKLPPWLFGRLSVHQGGERGC